MGALRVEVVYALPGEADTVSLTLATGTSVADAVRASGILERHPEIDLARHKLGVHGRAVAAATPARDGDRIEIYRVLLLDPKEARRRRARGSKRS